MFEKFHAFADRLRHLRESAGLSQYALAKMTGLTKQTMSKLETGRHDPSWTTIQLLAKALGVTCVELADPKLSLPAVETARPPGRPAKAPSIDPGEPGAEAKADEPTKGKHGGKGKRKTTRQS
jgi:transcriptional regulator with XRE-family HTH domain